MTDFVLSRVRQDVRPCERMEWLVLCHGWMAEILSLMSFIQDLMRELDEKEEVIKSVQDKAERLLLKNHPARLTIEVSPFSVVSMTIIFQIECSSGVSTLHSAPTPIKRL